MYTVHAGAMGMYRQSEEGSQRFKNLPCGHIYSYGPENSFGVGKDKRLLERTWQMEFYRVATQVLPNTVYISPDVGADFGSRGFVDFFVDDDRKWVIELLRDGERAEDHENRFKSDGIYAKILQYL